jgi:hypothetical protein
MTDLEMELMFRQMKSVNSASSHWSSGASRGLISGPHANQQVALLLAQGDQTWVTRSKYKSNMFSNAAPTRTFPHWLLASRGIHLDKDRDDYNV